MSDAPVFLNPDEPLPTEGTIAVLNYEGPSRGRIAAAAAKIAAEMGDAVPIIEIEREDEMNKMGMMLASIDASLGGNLIPPPPVKQPKRKPPEDVQARLKAEAQAKRERRRQKRLQNAHKQGG